ncbi:MAG: trp operon repressor [Rickettsiales bacterium]|jgi:TrpR-related protein YerC/YecD|nr:trp operon repressor [Rickettsiales bacterium]
MSGLYKAFASIKSEREFDSFLRDICTPAEIKALNERFEIARLLYAGGLSQKAVADKTGASVTTVTRVARFLNDEPYNGYRAVLARLHHA